MLLSSIKRKQLDAFVFSYGEYVVEPLCAALRPFAPVRVPEREHVLFAHEPELDADDVPPFGPVVVRL